MNNNNFSASTGASSTWGGDPSARAEARGERRTADSRAAAIRALGQAIAVSSLYNVHHAVSRRAIEDACTALSAAFEGGQPLTLRHGPAGWQIDGNAVPRSASIPPALLPLFKDHGVEELCFWPGVTADELAVLCELACLPVDEAPSPQELLLRRGVRRIAVAAGRGPQAASQVPPVPPASKPAPKPAPLASTEMTGEGRGERRAAAPAPAPLASTEMTGEGRGERRAAAPAPLASTEMTGEGRGERRTAAPAPEGTRPSAPRPGVEDGRADLKTVQRAPRPQPEPSAEAPKAHPSASSSSSASRRPFTAFLQRIVQRAGADPKEQASLFQEALSLLRDGMREALEGQIASAQAQLETHARHLVAECQRTQQVLASVAEGRVTVDPDGRVLMMNAAAEKIAGKPLRELAGRPLAESVAGDAQMLSLTLSARSESVSPRIVLRGGEETYEAFRKSVALVCDPDGRVLGTYGVLPHAAEAKEMARLREDFVSRVTHELKAPLTAISAALELLEARAAESLGGTERSLLETSQRNAGRLRGLIDDLLDFASLQSGTLQLRLEPVEALPLLEDAVSALEPWAQTKQVRLAIARPERAVPAVLADSGRLVQVVTNLLSNALKATPAGGQVQAGVRDEGAFARFWVSDTGCGIAPEDQARIFEKFVQVQGDGGTREGVGLGLAIVADLVARHGGSMSLESDRGKGAVFSFTVPIA